MTIHKLTHAQENLIDIEKKKINEFFRENFPWKTTPDSTMFIGFSFKIKVKLNGEGQVIYNKIIASNTNAYKIYPKYKSLGTINYGLFLKDKKRGIFIIPVIIDIIGSQPDKYYTNKNLLNYYTKTILGKSMSKAMKSAFYINQLGKKNTENYIYLEPMMIGIGKRTIY